MNWSDILLAIALTTAGCTLVYIGYILALRRAAAERQSKIDQTLAALATTMESLRRRVDALANTKPTPSTNNATTTQLLQTAEAEPFQPETLAVISAAAMAFLGKKAHVRAAQALPAVSGAGAWAQQGRVFVQTSHNLAREHSPARNRP